MLTYIVAFLMSLIVAAVATPLVTKFALKYDFIDRPIGGRKIHSRAIPRVGGIAVFVAFFTPLLALGLYTNEVSTLLYANSRLFFVFCAGAAAVLALGVYDDIKGASPKQKLLVQCLVAIGLWWVGFRIDILGNPFGETLQLGAWSLPLTVLWIVGVTNAMNLIDGLDGLASGLSLTATVVLFGVGYVEHAWLVCLLMVALSGALLGFLFFNFNPARIFLGDSGSMFLGFTLAVISVWTQRKGATAVALLIPVVALGVPILDTALSFVRRIARGQNPFRADKEHMHHRLLALGLSHRNAVFTLYTMSGVFALGGLALLDNDTTHRAIVVGTVVIIAVIFVRKIGILSVPGMAQKTKSDPEEIRDFVRVAARRIRSANSLEDAWGVLVEFMSKLPFEAGQLRVVESAGPKGSFYERVFTWHHSGQPWLGAERDLDRDRAIRVRLNEGPARFGELAVLRRRGVANHPHYAVAAELLRDALIDLCLERSGDLVPGEDRGTDGRVIPLRP